MGASQDLGSPVPSSIVCFRVLFFQGFPWLSSVQKNCKKGLHQFWHSMLSFQSVIHRKPSTFQSKDFKLPHWFMATMRKFFGNFGTLTKKKGEKHAETYRPSQSPPETAGICCLVGSKKLHPLCLVKREGTCNGVHLQELKKSPPCPHSPVGSLPIPFKEPASCNLPKRKSQKEQKIDLHLAFKNYLSATSVDLCFLWTNTHYGYE